MKSEYSKERAFQIVSWITPEIDLSSYASDEKVAVL